MLGAPTERIAGIAFFLFTLIQVPYFALDVSRSQDTAHGLVLLSPLQVTAAQVAKTFPSTRPVLEYALLPGGWMRENLTPYIRCMFKTSGKACRSERAKLTDLQHAQRANNLPVLVKLLDSNSTPQQWALVYGSALTVLSAVFAAAGYTVKTAMIGFALLALGVIQGQHILLPPGVMTAFLCIYSGFNWGSLRGSTRAQQQRAQSVASSKVSQQPGAKVQKLSSAADSGAAWQQKQRKQA